MIGSLVGLDGTRTRRWDPCTSKFSLHDTTTLHARRQQRFVRLRWARTAAGHVYTNKTTAAAHGALDSDSTQGGICANTLVIGTQYPCRLGRSCSNRTVHGREVIPCMLLHAHADLMYTDPVRAGPANTTIQTFLYTRPRWPEVHTSIGIQQQ